MTNYKPHAEARDKAFWSRACLIQFDLRFVETPKDPHERKSDLHLKETLQQECSGILAWLMRGCLAWQQQGLDIPASVQLATDRYRDEEDRLLLFIQECCIVRTEAYVKGGALYAAYKNWCEENQMGRAMSGKDFGQEIKKRFPDGRGQSNGRVIYRGIGLLTNDNDPQPRSLFEEQEQSTGNASRGRVEGASLPSTVDKLASKASPTQEENTESRGCRGSRHKLIINQQNTPSLRGDSVNHPLHPLQHTPVIISQIASKAKPQEVEGGETPSTLPLLEEDWQDETL